MKVRYIHSAEPGVEKELDIDQSFANAKAIASMIGTDITLEAHTNKTLEFFKLQKSQGVILEYQTI